MASHPPPAAPPRRKRSRWLRRAFELFLILAIVLAVQVWRTRDVPAGMVPNFTALMLDGRYATFEDWRSAQPEGAVALYFWAEWCPICRTVQGSIDAINQDWPMLTVATQSGNAAAVDTYLAERQLAWDTVIDEHGRLTKDFGLPGVPAVLIIDRDGQIRFTEIGFSSEIGLRLRLWWADRSSRRAADDVPKQDATPRDGAHRHGIGHF